jgi:hypothetical protein
MSQVWQEQESDFAEFGFNFFCCFFIFNFESLISKIM